MTNHDDGDRFLSLSKGGEVFLFIFDVETAHRIPEVLEAAAVDPESNFNRIDAALLGRMFHEMQSDS